MTGVIRAADAQDVLEWAVKAAAVLFSQAPEVERIAKDTLQTSRGAIIGGAGAPTYDDDGTRPGPTPGAALRIDYESRNIALYQAGLANLKRAVLDVAHASDQFLVMDAAEAKRHRLAQDGGEDCTKCRRWVAQEGNDWLRRGLCDACRKSEDRAKVEATK